MQFSNYCEFSRQDSSSRVYSVAAVWARSVVVDWSLQLDGSVSTRVFYFSRGIQICICIEDFFLYFCRVSEFCVLSLACRKPPLVGTSIRISQMDDSSSHFSLAVWIF